eukprot:172353_1
MAEDVGLLRFVNIYYKRHVGQLNISADGFKWTPDRASKSVHVPGDRVRKLEWTAFGKRFQLKLVEKLEAENEEQSAGYKLTYFRGFRSHSFSEMSKFVKERWGKDIKHIPITAKGWNFGDFQIRSQSLTFQADLKRALEIPFNSISQASVQNKNDVSVELKEPKVARDEACLTEIRFYVPPTGEGDVSAAEKFVSELTDKARLGLYDETEIVATFKDVLMVTPRGRYRLELGKDMLHMHGKTYMFKIKNAHIKKCWMLPTPDDHRLFIVGLSEPARQGQTQYPFLLMRFHEDEEIALSLNIEQKEIDEKYPEQLAQDMEGPYFDILSRVFRALCQTKVFTPGSFESTLGEKCIRCSLKANLGFLYPMESSFFFVHKPTTYIQHNEISTIRFARVYKTKGSSDIKTFDLEVNLRQSRRDVASRGNDTSITFTSINKDEFQGLFVFLAAKKIQIEDKEELTNQIASEGGPDDRANRRKLRGRQMQPGALKMKDGNVSMSSDDEVFEGSSSSDSESDEYQERETADEASDAEGGEPESKRQKSDNEGSVNSSKMEDE